MGDRYNIFSQMEHLQSKYVGTGHADTTKWEWMVNAHRDSYASYIGHPDVLSHIAIAENECRARVLMSYGDSAAELIKELSRSNDNVPRYDDIGVREVIEETNNLVSKNNEAIHSAEIQNLLNGQANGALDETFSEAELSVWANYNIKTCAIERNKRCLIAYHMKRLEKIKQLRWELGPVIPSHIRQGLSTRERSFSNEYNKVLSRLMRAHGGIDITQNLTPPKSLYAEVICQEDAGDLDLESGERIVLEKNMRYFLPRSAIEHLVRQGLLQEV